jgi:hypothetical protein
MKICPLIFRNKPKPRKYIQSLERRYYPKGLVVGETQLSALLFSLDVAETPSNRLTPEAAKIRALAVTMAATSRLSSAWASSRAEFKLVNREMRLVLSIGRFRYQGPRYLPDSLAAYPRVDQGRQFAAQDPKMPRRQRPTLEIGGFHRFRFGSSLKISATHSGRRSYLGKMNAKGETQVKICKLLKAVRYQAATFSNFGVNATLLPLSVNRVVQH